MLPDTIHTMSAVKNHAAPACFEAQYIALRRKEQWLCNDDELAALPTVARTHPHYPEWTIRQRSANKLVQYLQSRKKTLRILEAGCGNGWLAHLLAGIPGSMVTATDINTTELQQAKRVFGKKNNLVFTEGDIRNNNWNKAGQDIVVFAASIQYFPWLGEIIHSAFELLAPGGEIHILDSPFYDDNGKAKAEQRSAEYFRQAGFPEMAQHYYHHTHTELEPFDYTYLYDPQSWKQRLLPARITGPKNPFPWICITGV